MRVLVCGGRDYTDAETLNAVLDDMHAKTPFSTLIHGAAAGADTLADRWAHSRFIAILMFPADWATHGKAAGPIRNAKMLAEGKPDLVIAFPGGRGTADMITKAEAAGVHFMEVK